jgi:type I restriction enzyme S subunit
MTSEWPLTTIGEHVDLITGEAFQSARFETAPSNGVRLARGDNVKEGEFEWGEKSRFWPELTPDLERYLLSEGDVLLGMDGSKVGKNWVRVRREDLPCLLVQRVARLRAKPTMHQGFLRYLIGNPMFRDYVARVRTGTSIPHISGGQIRSYQICLPPLAEQRAIASVLGALDDKIDLNRRMCQTLEEMARALFKSWFVDFDPVRAKMEGRNPGLPKEIADLFPSRLVDSDLGPIPEGWSVETTSEIADVIYGAPFASSRFNDRQHGVPLVRIRDLGSQDPAVWTDEVHPKGYRLSSGDVVVGMDGEFRAHLWAGPEAWLNQRVCVFKPRVGYCRVFVRNAITAPLEFIERTETATTVIHLGKSDIDQFKFVVAPPSVHQRFSDLALPWYGRMVVARHEAATLTALRDTLLPKLISGEVRVPVLLGSMQETAS